MQLEDLVEDVEVFDPVERQREEWLQKRLGKLTCSKFGDLIGTGREKDAKFTKTGYTYLRRCVAERLGSWYSTSAASMSWGNDNEVGAVCEYENQFGVQVDHGLYRYYEYNADIGGTPDGLVGADGCIEIKCPYDPAVHIETMLNQTVPDDYQWQVVGHLLVTGRQWCDFVSFDPRIPEADKRRLVRIRVERSLPRIELLLSRLTLAVDTLNEMLKKIRG